MQKFFLNRHLVTIVVVLVVAFGLMAGSMTISSRGTSSPLIIQFGNDVVGTVGKVVSAPVNALSRGTGAVSDLLNTYSENRTLKKQVASLAQTKVRNEQLANENSQLKKEAKLNKSLTDYTTVTAAVTARTPSAWQQQVIINKGQNNGVKKDMPVMSQSGLIGRVSQANKTNSKVELLSDTSDSANRFSIQIKGKDGRSVNGVINGYSANTGQLIVGQITSKAHLSVGSRVTTNGMGGMTPKGLYVGRVSRVGKDDYGLAQKVYIKPAADLNNLDIVTVAELR